MLLFLLCRGRFPGEKGSSGVGISGEGVWYRGGRKSYEVGLVTVSCGEGGVVIERFYLSVTCDITKILILHGSRGRGVQKRCV